MIKSTKSVVLHGEALKALRAMPDRCVDVVLTSPPYWALRNYGGEKKQIGNEPKYSQYVESLMKVFAEIHRVLRDDGVVWLNIGDIWWSKSLCRTKPIEAMYGNRKLGKLLDRNNIQVANQRGGLSSDQDGIKPKDIVGLPWRVALALQDAGWYLRQDIIWSKPNPQPERKLDRFTKSHEYIFMLTKSYKYNFNCDKATETAVDGGLRQARSVLTVATERFDSHYATMPLTLAEKLLTPVLTKGCVVLDIFSGLGTTGVVAINKKATYVGIELHVEYARKQSERLKIPMVKLAKRGFRKKQLRKLFSKF